MTQKNFPTFVHEVTLNAMDGHSQTVDPASNLLRKPLSSIFPRPVSLLSPLCILNFAW